MNARVRPDGSPSATPLIKLIRVSLAGFSLLILPALVEPAAAALFNVDLVDNDGPHIMGYVDTTANTMTVTSWTENPGGNSFWTASNLPRTYDAVDAVGDPFDVPDNWDGTIGNTWGFLNPLGNMSAGWNEGTFVNDTSSDGWGIFRVAGTNHAGTNETQWSAIPVDPNSAPTATFDAVTVSPIPEPESALLLVLGAAAGIWRARRIASGVPSTR